MIDRIKIHWGALLIAVFIGFVMILPIVLSVQKIGISEFRGIYPMLNDDEDYYLTLTREVYDGHYALSNPYFKEHKVGTYLFPPLPEIVYANASKVLGVSIVTEAVINDFFLPAVSFLLLYALIFRMTRKRNIALSLTSLFFLFFIFTFQRPVNPQFGFVFLLLGMHLIWIIATVRHDLKKIFKYNFLLAVVFGVLVYTYPFYWMTLGVVYSLWTFGIAVYDGDFKYWIKNWLFFFLPAGLIALPFILNVFEIRHSQWFLETNPRMGFIDTHIPGAFFNVLLMIISAPLAYFVLIKAGNKRLAIFPIVLVVGGVILNWQNIVTGQTLQFPPHFYTIMFLFIFLIASQVLLFIDKTWVSKVTLIFLVGFFVFLANKQKGEFLYTLNKILHPIDIKSLQHLSGPLSWLNSNTPKDSSVYVLGNLNWAIPIYTHNNVYFAANAGFSLMSDAELEDRWVIQKFFDQVKESDISTNRDIWSNKFIDAYQNKESRRKILELITRKKYPESVLMDRRYIDRVLEKDRAFKALGFEKALKTYSADYLVLDTKDSRYLALDKVFRSSAFLEELARINDIVIYKVR